MLDFKRTKMISFTIKIQWFYSFLSHFKKKNMNCLVSLNDFMNAKERVTLPA
jgi:hypothetical protein